MAAKADCAVLFSQHRGRCASLGTAPVLCPSAYSVPCPEHVALPGRDLAPLGIYFRVCSKKRPLSCLELEWWLVAARGSCCLRTQLDRKKEASRVSCLQKKICSRYKSSHSFFPIWSWEPATSHPLPPYTLSFVGSLYPWKYLLKDPCDALVPRVTGMHSLPYAGKDWS